MNIVGVKQLRNELDRYISLVKKGQSFTVVRRSKAVFKITPIEEDQWETVVDFTKFKKGGISGKELLKALRDE